jgi:hypothetical protein
MIDETTLQTLEQMYCSAKCPLCGTTNGIHRVLMRDGWTTPCRGGDLRMLVLEVCRLREWIKTACKDLDFALNSRRSDDTEGE